MYKLPHRFVCTVLEEMRCTIKHINIFTYFRAKRILSSQIEEVQTLVNRMEAGLEYTHDIKKLHDTHKELRLRVQAIHDKYPQLKEEDDSDE